jgi:phosphatidylinositol kinase/protein kinase (PI-3  family)
MGIKRERTSLVLTPEMGFVIGAKNYRKSGNYRRFEGLCRSAFRELRKRSQLLVNLFSAVGFGDSRPHL